MLSMPVCSSTNCRYAELRGSGRLLHFELTNRLPYRNILRACVPQNLLEMMKAWTETLVEKGREGH